MNELTPQKCPRCGTDLPVGSTGGVCPRCAAGLLQATQTEIPGEGASAFTPPTAAELAAKFPQLEILGLIGRGGMGAVYKARQKELDRIVALKILPPDIGKDAAFAERFSREAKALAKLNHPGIVTIYDSGRADGLYFFLMEFVDGMNLRELLHNGRISAREALAIVPQICDALQFAHDQGIVHRDIKPENLLMDRRGRVKVADFGLAKLVGGAPEPAAAKGAAGESPALTEAGKVMGTPNYMSPEQMDRPGEVDHRADIYALGVVFYQMLTGELPDKPLQPPSNKVQIDVRLDQVVLRALEKQPERRYQQASVLKTQVETIASGPAGLTPGAMPNWYRGIDYKSKATLFGLPLLHVTSGLNPETGRVPVSRGIIAIGGVAQGVVAIGGMAMGGVTIGGLSLGIFSFGGLAAGLIAFGGGALGLLGALGGGAIAPIALGGLAIGWFATGGSALGPHALDASHQDPVAVQFFLNWAKSLMHASQWINAVIVILGCTACIGVPMWLQRLKKRKAGKPSKPGTSSPLTKAQIWEIYGNLTGGEKIAYQTFSIVYGIWNSATFFLPTACLFFFHLPTPLDWIIASSLLMVGLSFYPVWWKLQARLLCASAWAQEKGIRAETIRTCSPTLLMLLAVLWFLAVGVIWWQNYHPEGVWQPWLAEASIQDASAGGTACVTEVRHYGQTLWLRMTCNPLPRSAALSLSYTGPMIELPDRFPAEATNVDCLVTTAPHSTGRVIAGTNDLSGQTNFTVAFVLPDEAAAAAAVKQIRRMDLDQPHGVNSPLFWLRRTLGKDSSGKVIEEQVFGYLQLQARSPGSAPRSFISTTNATQNIHFADGDPDRWWPTQVFPKTVVRTTSQQDFPEPRMALQMMVQSVAGLAAQAVNDGRGTELVWVYNGEGDLEKWYDRLLVRHPELGRLGTFGPWDLVDRYAKQGLIKGYILYRRDKSVGDNNTDRPGMDYSVNVATSLAGVLGGIIVDEDLEPTAQAHGLKRLLDVRDKSQLWCFQTYQSQFNRRMLCFQDPRAPHVRDLAIAQRVFTTYGSDQPTAQAMAWLEPLSPILGWNSGDEFANTDLSTSYGDIQTASNWSLNLPVLMAGTEKLRFPAGASFDPRTIDWEDSRSAVSFVDTDGDNVQWLQGNFFGNDSYWGNAERGKIPFGWSVCFDQLEQLCPEAIENAEATRTTNDWFIEWGGGYYYPDHFGSRRADRWELLARHARRTWDFMKKENTRVIGFNFVQPTSPEARRACEVFAGQTDGLLAIFAFQYSPYEGGAGKTFWVKDHNGIEVPVITARYAIWEHANDRDRAGTPAKIARDIRQSVAETDPAQLPRYDWVIAHAWSYFKKAPGADENAENLPQDTAVAEGGVRGYSPVTWCADRLPTGIRAVSPEELIWRIRMKHDPAQTKKLISQF